MCPSRGQPSDPESAPWNDADLAFLINLLAEGKPLAEIAQAMERPPAQVIALAARHGLSLAT
jgi:hypothetical protein